MAFPLMVAVYIVINLFGFAIMGIDKKRARRNEYRISEKALWLTAFLLGAAGMTAGMNIFRHKTKHAQFRFGLPILTLAQLILGFYFAGMLIR